VLTDRINAKAAAAILGLSVRAVYALGEAGELTVYRPSLGRRTVRFDRAEVEARACRSTATRKPDAGGSSSTTTSKASAFAGVSFSQPGSPDPKPKRSTAKKARPYGRSRTDSPRLGASLTKLSLVTSERGPRN
jgi:excisionase family DNA binding protein